MITTKSKLTSTKRFGLLQHHSSLPEFRGIYYYPRWWCTKRHFARNLATRITLRWWGNKRKRRSSWEKVALWYCSFRSVHEGIDIHRYPLLFQATGAIGNGLKDARFYFCYVPNHTYICTYIHHGIVHWYATSAFL